MSDACMSYKKKVSRFTLWSVNGKSEMEWHEWVVATSIQDAIDRAVEINGGEALRTHNEMGGVLLSLKL